MLTRHGGSFWKRKDVPALQPPAQDHLAGRVNAMH
jgi:hypothetical protein